MKNFLLLLSVLILTLPAFSQYTFDDGLGKCVLHPGFSVGQGISVGSFDNPSNGCGNADDDCGLITPGVGGNNPAFVATPQIEPPTVGLGVQVQFTIYVFDANLKCTNVKPFPCETYVTGYVVDLSYNSSTAPTTYYGVSDKQLINPNGPNLITIPVVTNPGNNPTRVYLDFSTDLTCDQPNTKYVIDQINIFENITLPVKFKNFSATRNGNSVNLDWVTVSENNNKGFDVQRLTSSAVWESIGFVPTQSKQGFVENELRYQFTDANSATGITQYRLVQNDLDGKVNYSAIRAVQGIGQLGRTIIAPNPSINGQVNVIFESAGERRNLQLTDMVGRLVKQWNGYADNSLQLTGLQNGIYQLRIVDAATGAQSIEKIVVSGK